MNKQNSIEFDSWQEAWQAQEQSLAQQWQWTRDLVQQTRLDRTQDLIRRSQRKRLLELAIWGAILIGLGNYIAGHTHLPAPFISGLVLFFFSLLGTIGVIGELFRLGSIAMQAPIVTLQRKLEAIRTHRLLYFRLAMASVPLFMAHIFFWTELLLDFDLYPVADPTWFWANVGLSAALVAPTIWLIRNLGRPARSPKWVARLVRSVGGKELQQALSHLDELQSFQGTPRS